MIRFGLVTIILSGVLATGTLCQEAKRIPTSALLAQVRETRDSIELVGLGGDYVVSGVTHFHSHFLAARRIIFKPNSTLVFSELAWRNRDELIIATERLIVEDKNRPGRITWDRPFTPGVSSATGQAASGSHGKSYGASGNPGANGKNGNPGRQGRGAPNLTLFVRQLESGAPIIDFRGASGGKGGTGQRGGDGGAGHQGRPASQSLFGCRRGCGRGGNGGDGGAGGNGGSGGDGGPGGTVRIASLSESLPTLTTIFRIDLSGGAGGPGGTPGAGGKPGPGGRQGAKALPYCKDEPSRKGKGGSPGRNGNAGVKGNSGPQGTLMTTSFTDEQFKRIFGI